MGDGHFGVVQKAIWIKSDGEKLGCAVKHLKKGTMELLTEVVNMQQLCHENIVRLYGVCLKEDMKMLMVKNFRNSNYPTFAIPFGPIKIIFMTLILQGVQKPDFCNISINFLFFQNNPIEGFLCKKSVARIEK